MRINISRLVAAAMLLTSANALAKSWNTVDFAGFDEVVRVEIFTNYPTYDPALDNIILDDGSLTFEEVISPDDIEIPITPYSESGFILNADSSANGLFGADVSGVNSNGTTIFGWCGGCGDSITMSLVQDGDAPFDLLSIDFSTLELPEAPLQNNLTFTVMGYFADGSTISQQYTHNTVPSIPVNAPIALLLLTLMMMGIGTWKIRRSV